MRNPWLIRLSEPNNPISLENHPWFELVQVAGSEEKVGMYTSDFEWRLPFERPRNDFKISSLDDVKDVEIVFSALPSNVAAIWEKKLAKWDERFFQCILISQSHWCSNAYS